MREAWEEFKAFFIECLMDLPVAQLAAGVVFGFIAAMLILLLH